MIRTKLVVLMIIFAGISIDTSQLQAMGAGDGEKETTVIKIEGMSCRFCAKMAEESMTSVEGVETVNLDLATGLATVTYDKQTTDPEKIAMTVKKDTYFESEVVKKDDKETK